MFGGALAAYVDCQPSPEVAADAMVPLIEPVASAQSAGTVLQAPAEMVAVAIWGQVHGLVSLELAQVGPPDAGRAAATAHEPFEALIRPRHAKYMARVKFPLRQVFCESRT